MTEPAPTRAEFQDVLGLLAATDLAPAPRGDALLSDVLGALAAPSTRATSLEAAIARDADEAWSLALAFLGDAEAAHQAVVSGFVALGREARAEPTPADGLRAQALAAMDVWRLLAKSGAAPELPGAALEPEARLALLLQVGLGRRDLRIEAAPDLTQALVAATPRPGHERGDELCRLLARELLGELAPAEVPALDALRRAHPTSAALIRARWEELIEVPPRVFPGPERLAAAVGEQLARERGAQARSDALRLRVRVSCSFCHDGLSRPDAVFCAGCLAPHHEECFMTHGKCSAAGCGVEQLVRPTAPATTAPATTPPAAPRRRGLWWGGALALLTGLGAAAAWSGVGRAPAVVTVDPEVLRAAEARTTAERQQREATRAKNRAMEDDLAARRVSMNFDGTPLLDAVDFLRDITGLNYVVSREARDLIEGETVTVSLRLQDISFRNALRLILSAHEHLTYRVDQGLIRIQTTDEPSSDPWVEVIDVSDIMSGAARARGGFQVDGEVLVELIERLRGEEAGEFGSLEVSGSALVLRGPDSTHTATHELLRYLREGASSRPAAGPPAWETELRRALDKRISVDWRQKPLAAALDEIAQVTEANLVLSPKVDDDQTTVTLRLKDVSALNALQLVLEQTHLAMIFQNEALCVVHPALAYGELQLRLLDVRDLLSWLEPDQLRELVLNAIDPAALDDLAQVRVHQGQLIVYQSPQVQDELDQILAKLRVGHAEGQQRGAPR